MKTRTINKKLLKECVKVTGLERIAVEADCSASLLQKLCSDSYQTVPSIRNIDGICRATACSIDELFPIFDEKKESA
jgi:DNA-binding Xre family transcriptional regulator